MRKKVQNDYYILSIMDVVTVAVLNHVYIHQK